MAGFAVEQTDVEYARPDGTPLLARVYRPRGAGPWPALIDLHGGAWSLFDRTVDWYYDEALAADGMVVVALDFRQAPVRYPAAVADVAAGIRWVKAHAARLGVRPGKVGIVGGSSGGHLAMLAALRPGAPEFGTTAVPGAEDVDAEVAYVLALWPILDPAARYRYLLGRRANPWPASDPAFHLESLVRGHEAFFGEEATMERASTLRIVQAGEAECLPPVWLAHAEHDENVTLAMSERFVDAYRRAGGDAVLAFFPGVGHGFGNFPGPDADRCIAQMREFIRTLLAS